MDFSRSILFSIEIWGAVFSLIASLTIVLTRHFDRNGSRKLLLVMLCSAALMICDAVSILFRGDTSEIGHEIGRASCRERVSSPV